MPDDRGDAGANPPNLPTADEDLQDASAELSHLLAELARTPEVAVDVAAGWTPAVRPGDVVAGRFELRRELGRGGFGLVFEALDRELGREVAFKAVLPGRRLASHDDGWVQREAKAVACLNHPNIVTLHDLGAAPTGPYLIFELLHGETLAQRLRRGPFALRDAVALAAQVARVLDHAHRAGVVHRDLKPGNVFLCEGGAVKVLDFGLAHLFGRGGPVSGGTPAYMAPEQWRSEPGDERTDLFALGVLLHQMLSGTVPYRVAREGSRERSEAQEPGPPPALPRGLAPERVRRLVRRMLEKDPAERPQSAAEVAAELQRVQRGVDGRLRRAGVAAAALAGAAALASVAYAIRPGPPVPPTPFVVAVADFENGTGDRDLDGLSGLLVTSLEQSRRFQVIARGRLLSLLRSRGRGDAPRIDETIARELARTAGAQFVLAGSARKTGDAIALEVRLVDPKDGRSARAFRERAEARTDLLAAIDRISDAARKALHEPEEDVRASRIRVAQAVTSSVEAYDAYFQGADCVARPSLSANWTSVNSCADRFRRALELDPTFALAHHELAVLLGMGMGAPRDVQTHAEAALRYIDRVPPKEGDLIRAWKAHLDGRDDDALAAYARVLERFPDDPQALFLSGHLYFQRGEMSAAIPFFQKLLALDPAAEWPLDYLVTALGVERRRSELAQLLARLEAGPRTAAVWHALVRAHGWLGDPGQSIEVAQRAVEASSTPAARSDLATALSAGGRFAEAEEVLRRLVNDDPSDLLARRWLAVALRAQGRRAEALRVIGDAERAIVDTTHPYARAYLIAGDGDVQALWREAARSDALQPDSAATLAVLLALAGDLAHARTLAGAAAPGSAAAVEYDAIVAWREGDASAALAKLAALEASAPWPQQGLPPAYLVAEIALDAGDPAEAAGAAERYRALWPRGVWRGWAYPRSLYLSAIALHRTGDAAGARDAAGRLRDLLRRADHGEPLVAALRRLDGSLPK